MTICYSLPTLQVLELSLSVCISQLNVFVFYAVRVVRVVVPRNYGVIISYIRPFSKDANLMKPVIYKCTVFTMFS